MIASDTHASSTSNEEYRPNPDDWKKYAARGTEQLREMCRENVGRNMLLALAAGLGAGVLIGAARSQKNSTPSWLTKENAERMARQALKSLAPNAVSSHLKS